MATKFNVAPTLSVPFQTADATPVVAAEFDATAYPLCAFWVEVKVTAVYADGSKAAAYWLTGLFRTSAAGTLTQVGATASVIAAIEDTAGMDCTLAASGAKAQVTVTGVAATTINWLFDNTIRHAPFSV
jgi:hypothetical protein